MTSADYFQDLYDWLEEAYGAAMLLAQPQIAMQYVAQMRAMESAGVITPQEEKKEYVN